MTFTDHAEIRKAALDRLARHGFLTEDQAQDAMTRYLRSHEPPRNSGEGTAVNGPMPLGEKDESLTAEHE